MHFYLILDISFDMMDIFKFNNKRHLFVYDIDLIKFKMMLLSKYTGFNNKV